MDPYQPGPIYTAEQISIPPSLPDILKEFTKSAIRTQPHDLLEWSAAYFQSLAKGDVPPVKNRYEVGGAGNEGGLTKGRLSALHNQFKDNKKTSVDTIRENWVALGCESSKLDEILSLGDLDTEEIKWTQLLALSCTALESNVCKAITTLCDIMTVDEEGGASRIPYEVFSDLYTFIAKVDDEISDKQRDRVLEWLKKESKRFDGMVGPREFQHQNCPRLTLSTKL